MMDRLEAQLLEQQNRVSELIRRIASVCLPTSARTVPGSLLPDLTARERQILRLLAPGRTNREIGPNLDLLPGPLKPGRPHPVQDERERSHPGGGSRGRAWAAVECLVIGAGVEHRRHAAPTSWTRVSNHSSFWVAYSSREPSVSSGDARSRPGWRLPTGRSAAPVAPIRDADQSQHRIEPQVGGGLNWRNGAGTQPFCGPLGVSARTK
jgi:hypothetical protein